jgi:hypothetical protein
VLIALVLGAACGDQGAPGVALHVTVNGADSSLVELTVPVEARRCSDGAGLLILGVAERHGMLVWVATAGGPDTGAYALSPAGDTLPGRHARASLRYLIDDRAHSLAIDSGTVHLERAGDALSGTVTGSGFDHGAGHRPLVRAELRGIPVLPDSGPCREGGT